MDRLCRLTAPYKFNCLLLFFFNTRKDFFFWGGGRWIIWTSCSIIGNSNTQTHTHKKKGQYIGWRNQLVLHLSFDLII